MRSSAFAGGPVTPSWALSAHARRKSPPTSAAAPGDRVRLEGYASQRFPGATESSQDITVVPCIGQSQCFYEHTRRGRFELALSPRQIRVVSGLTQRSGDTVDEATGTS